MTDGLKWTVNHVPGSDDKFWTRCPEENVTANEFHSFPQYPCNTTGQSFRSCFPILKEGICKR